MSLHHLLVPGVDCAPDEFDSYAAIGHAQPPQRLQPLERMPWTGVERRKQARTAIDSSSLRVTPHAAQCPDDALTDPPLDVGADTVNEGVV